MGQVGQALVRHAVLVAAAVVDLDGRQLGPGLSCLFLPLEPAADLWDPKALSKREQ